MKIVIASGKGGAGKTTLAINLARAADRSVQLLDCDVEEPNVHLFLAPKAPSMHEVTVPLPEVDETICSACGACVEFCRFNALLSFGIAPTVFPELCHGCGGCMRVCPNQTIREISRRIGVVASWRSGKIGLVSGRLDIGQAMAPPLIRAVKAKARDDVPVFIDAPPGAACPAVAALTGADFVVLAAEPTRFGLHDLTLAVRMVRELKLKFGVVVNRAVAGADLVRDYCRSEGSAVLAEIPDDRRIAESYARGEILIDALPEYRKTFGDLLTAILSMGGRA
jgi:MinD superfamily P-loop ATPase